MAASSVQETACQRLKGLSGSLQQCRLLNFTAGVQHMPGPGSLAAVKLLMQYIVLSEAIYLRADVKRVVGYDGRCSRETSSVH
jgi:hypothetical protein